MATRRIPDPKIGGSIPSEVILFFSFFLWWPLYPLPPPRTHTMHVGATSVCYGRCCHNQNETRHWLNVHRLQRSLPNSGLGPVCSVAACSKTPKNQKPKNQKMRSPGIEPGSITWQATIITTRPRTLIIPALPVGRPLSPPLPTTGSINSVGRVLVL